MPTPSWTEISETPEFATLGKPQRRWLYDRWVDDVTAEGVAQGISEKQIRREAEKIGQEVGLRQSGFKDALNSVASGAYQAWQGAGAGLLGFTAGDFALKGKALEFLGWDDNIFQKASRFMDGAADQANRNIKVVGEEVIPVDDPFEDAIGGKILSGLGQLGWNIPAAVAGMPVMMSSLVGQLYNEQMTDYKESGGQSQIEGHLLSMLYAAPAAALETAIGWESLFTKAARGEAIGGIRKYLIGSFGEGAEEVLQGAWSDLIADLTYATEQRTLTPEWFEQRKQEFIVGAAVGAAATLLTGKATEGKGEQGVADAVKAAQQDGQPQAPEDIARAAADLANERDGVETPSAPPVTPAVTPPVAQEVRLHEKAQAAEAIVKDPGQKAAVNRLLEIMEAANPEKFAGLQVEVGDIKGPDGQARGGVYDPAANKLTIGKTALSGKKPLDYFGHEGAHFVAMWGLGDDFVAGEWGKLTKEQQDGAAREVTLGKHAEASTFLKEAEAQGRDGAFVLRQEWAAFQTLRVLRGDATGVPPSLLTRIRQFIQRMREYISGRFAGSKKYTTEELDRMIAEIIERANPDPDTSRIGMPTEENAAPKRTVSPAEASARVFEMQLPPVEQPAGPPELVRDKPHSAFEAAKVLMSDAEGPLERKLAADQEAVQDALAAYGLEEGRVAKEKADAQEAALRRKVEELKAVVPLRQLLPAGTAQAQAAIRDPNAGQMQALDKRPGAAAKERAKLGEFREEPKPQDPQPDKWDEMANEAMGEELYAPVTPEEDARHAELEKAAKAGDKQAEREAAMNVDKAGQAAASRLRKVVAGDEVSGLRVGSNIPNTASIAASLEDYKSFGLREFPASLLRTEPGREIELKDAIQKSGRIDPLIVVMSGHKDGPAYILEGSHRIDAIASMGVPTFPALVLYDRGETDPFTYDSEGKLIPLSKRFDPQSNSILYAPEDDLTKAAKAKGYDVGPVYHGGTFDVGQGDTEFSDWTHFGTKAAAEERIGGSGVVDGLIKSIEVEQDAETGQWYYSVEGLSTEENYDTEEDAYEAAVAEARQMADYADAPEATFTKAFLRGPFIRTKDLMKWEVNDLLSEPSVENAIGQAGLSAVRAAAKSGDKEAFSVLTALLQAKGFNGIVYRNNVEDKGKDSYIVFESNSAKSAELVTRDPMSGSEIPISERFNPNNRNILYAPEDVAAAVAETAADRALRKGRKILKKAVGLSSIKDGWEADRVARSGALNAHRIAVESAFRRADNAFKQHWGKSWNKLGKARRAQVDKWMTDREYRAASAFPQDIADALTDIRNAVDGLSRAAKAEGMLTPGQELAFDARDGVYMNRSYRVFEDSDWLGKLAKENPAVVKQAARFISDKLFADKVARLADEEWLRRNPARQRVSAKARASAEWAGIAEDLAHDPRNRPTDAEVEGVIRDITTRTDTDAFFVKPADAKQDLTILKRRKDIAPEIRALMGEYDDTMVAAARSVAKLAGMVENRRMLRALRDRGLRDGWLSRTRTDEAFREFPEAGPLQDFGGLYTHPDVIEELSEAFKAPSDNWAFTLWHRINGYSKLAKTAFYPASQVGNVLSNNLLLLANGQFSARGVQEGWLAAKAAFTANTKEVEAYLKRAAVAGVVGDDAMSGELAQALTDAGRRMTGENWYDPAAPILNTALKVPLKLYQLGDSFFKVIRWESEKADLRKAFPGMAAADIDKMAGERVRRTMPTYSKLMPVVQGVGRVGIVAPFVAWPSEMIRVAVQIPALGLEDLRTGMRTKNYALARYGAKRLAGYALAVTIPTMIAAISRSMNDVDDDDDRAVRPFLPPWNRLSELCYLSPIEGGRFRAFDLTRIDPFSIHKKIFFRAPYFADNPKDAMAQMAIAFLDPYISATPVTGAALKSVDAYKDAGGRVNQAVLETAARAFWDALEPGVITSARRLAKASQPGYTDAWGRTYDMKEEIAGTAGLRPVSTNILQTIALFSGKDYRRQFNAVEWRYKRVAESLGSVTQEEADEAYAEAELLRRDIFSQFHGELQAAQRLGISRDQLFRALASAPDNNAGFGKGFAAQLITGNYVPMRRVQRRKSATP